MYRMLIPVDRKVDRALHQARYAANLAESGADVEATVLYVDPPGNADAVDVVFDSIDAAVGAADHLEAKGVSVERLVEEGSVVETVLRTADELDSHEIVMGGRKRSGVAQVLLGSTVQDVFISTERPVTITGTEMLIEEGPRTVIVPVSENKSHARKQAAYVAELGSAGPDVKAVVLHVFPGQDYKGAPPHSFEDNEAAVEAADDLADRGIDVERVGIGGNVSQKILEAAAERDAHGIVMGGRKRSGVQKVLLGSITQDVLLSADRPVTLTG
ncbi:universal stress protein [Halobellus marinus]|uniref:universal stress protein n=1 Tax=Halobellus TaxID=1073986 RepID=UPI0028AF6FA9|nr:universal stress protein [Halobellus sp. DFY28]